MSTVASMFDVKSIEMGMYVDFKNSGSEKLFKKKKKNYKHLNS